jgi:hypothetical protein
VVKNSMGNDKELLVIISQMPRFGSHIGFDENRRVHIASLMVDNLT